MHSLFSASGARKSKHTLPNEREGFALAVGASMQWSKLWSKLHVRPRLTLATTRSSRRHAAHVRHRLRRPHRPRLTSEPAHTGMAGDG